MGIRESDGARRTRSLPAVVSPELVLFLGHHVLPRPIRGPKHLTDKWASLSLGPLVMCVVERIVGAGRSGVYAGEFTAGGARAGFKQPGAGARC